MVKVLCNEPKTPDPAAASANRSAARQLPISATIRQEYNRFGLSEALLSMVLCQRPDDLRSSARDSYDYITRL
jgi:hypothetical protein